MKFSRLLLVVAGVFAGAGLALALFLGSDRGGAFLLKHGQGFLQSHFQTRMDFTSARLNLFNGFEFHNLHLVIERPDVQADVVIPEARLDYELSLWHRRLRVQTLSLLRPRVRATVHAAEPSATVPAKTEKAKPLTEWLAHPPLSLDLNDVQMRHLDLEVTQLERGESTTIRLEDVGFRFTMLLVPGRLSSEGEWNLQGGSLMPKAAEFASLGQWHLSLRDEGPAGWNFVLEPSQVDFHLKGLALKSGEAHQSVAQLEGKGHAEAKARLQGGVLRLESVSFNGQSEVVGLASQQGKQELTVKRVVAHFEGALAERFQALATLHMEGVKAPALAQPLTLDWRNEFQSPREVKAFHLDSALSIGAFKVLKLACEAQRGGDRMEFSGQLNLNAEPGLRILLGLPQLGRGQLTTRMDFDGDLDAERNLRFHSQSEVLGPVTLTLGETARWNSGLRHLDLTAEAKLLQAAFGEWGLKSDLSLDLLQDSAAKTGFKTQGQTQLTQLKAGSKPLPVEWNGPITVKHEVSRLDSGRTEAHLDGQIPAMAAKGSAHFSDTHMQADIRSLDESGKNLEFTAFLKQGQIKLLAESAKTLHPLDGLNAQLSGSLRDGVLSVPKIQLEVDHSLLSVTGEATGHTQLKDFQMALVGRLAFPQGFPEVAGQTLQGEILMPLKLTVFHGRQFALQSDLTFKDFSWHKAGAAVEQINGRIPFEESLLWDGKHVRFTDLITENPFERVDFNRVRPLLRGNEQLRVEKVQWQDRAYGPFIGFFSLRQNLISVHQFDADLGGGRVYGEMFFNVHPANLQVGFLGRLTGLNLTEFLPSQYVKGGDAQARDLSARAGLVFNLNRATLDGRMDVTEIGGRQLMALINTLDPNFRDEKMNKIRGLLQVGYPTAVNAAFAEGYMDMDIDLNLLSFVTRESVHGIPLTGFIAKATAGIVQQTRKGILQ